MIPQNLITFTFLTHFFVIKVYLTGYNNVSGSYERCVEGYYQSLE